jgi:hypothetical protein
MEGEGARGKETRLKKQVPRARKEREEKKRKKGGKMKGGG